MSLTIDNGSTVYYFKSNSEIKRIRIEGGDTQISYHAAENLDNLSASVLTRTSTVESNAFVNPMTYAPKAPLTYSIEDISYTSEIGGSSRRNSTEKRNSSLRRATVDLLRVVKEKLKVVSRASGKKVQTAVRSMRKSSIARQ